MDAVLGAAALRLTPRQRRQFLQDALALCQAERGMRFRKAVVCPRLAAWGADDVATVAREAETVDYWFKVRTTPHPSLAARQSSPRQLSVPTQGPGSPRARAAACPLLRAMLSGALSAIEDEEAAPHCAPTVALRFGHAETLMPLVGLLVRRVRQIMRTARLLTRPL